MAKSLLGSGWLERASTEVGASFGFAFRDPNWPRKFVVGSIVVLASFFLVGLVFLAGYVVRLARQVQRGSEELLPEWDDWSGLAQDGIRGIVLYLAHLIPVILVGVLLVLALGGAISLAASPDDMPTGIGLLIVLAIFVGSVLYAVFVIVASIVALASIVRYLRDDELQAGFEFKESIAAVRRDPLTYLIVFWTIGVSNFVAQFGIVLLCVGILPATFWSIVAAGHALGRATLVELEVGN